MLNRIVKLILGMSLVSSLKQTKDDCPKRLSRNVKVNEKLTMFCPFRVAKVNKDELQVGIRTLGYQISTTDKLGGPQAGDARLMIQLKRGRVNVNSITAHLREGNISVGCNRVSIVNTISTVTDTSISSIGVATFMQTLSSA